jgi:hypothetical protein
VTIRKNILMFEKYFRDSSNLGDLLYHFSGKDEVSFRKSDLVQLSDSENIIAGMVICSPRLFIHYTSTVNFNRELRSTFHC